MDKCRYGTTCIGYDIAEEPSIAQTQNKKLYYIIRLKM